MRISVKREGEGNFETYDGIDGVQVEGAAIAWVRGLSMVIRKDTTVERDGRILKLSEGVTK